MLKKFLVPWFALAVVAACLAGPARAGEGGTLKGRFVYDGKAPAPAALAITSDAAFCGKKENKDLIVDESLVVGPQGGLANVCVHMFLGRGDKVEIHPAYEAKKKEVVRIDNIGCRFVPHVVGLWTEQKLVMGNKDSIGHNIKIDGIEGKSCNPLLPPGGELTDTFDVAERIPLPVGCNIHPWMRARLLIQNHPYFAISDAEGNFEIKNIPPGQYEFRAYHERPGYVRTVKLNGKQTEWKAGRFSVNVEEGKTVDLGDVGVPASLLASE